MFMPHIFVLLLVLFHLPVALGIITGFTTPKTTLHPGQTFKVTFITSNHIINNQQFYAVFGLSPGPAASPGVLGTTSIGGNGFDIVLSGHSVQGTGSFDVSLTIPKGFTTASGKVQTYTVTTGVLNSVGVALATYVQFLNDTISIAPK